MLRPSRPMMRPLRSSERSWTTDTVVSAAWPRGEALHRGGEDGASTAVGLLARLLLGLADQASAVVLELVLELAEHDLLGLARGQAGDPLELAQLVAASALDLLLAVVEIALAVGDRLLTPLEVGEPDVDRLLLAE